MSTRVDDISELLEDLVRYGHLYGAAEGIAKQVISRGLGSLSDKQREVFDKYIKQPYFKEHCERCHSSIPGSELYAAWENGGYCGWCSHQMAKGE